MICRDFVTFLLDYVDDVLSPAERSVFDEHLLECPWCVAYLRTYLDTIRLGRAAFTEAEAQVPAAVPDELIAAIRTARRAAP